MTQTWALLVDAYRELNSKRLFWLVLALSLLIVACFACVGINDRGLTFLIWDIPISILNTSLMSEALFYRLMFLTLGFSVWLSWAATILALISTAGIFPDFLAGGSIELTLSKPIGRFRLFLTKYMTGLLFVAIQVAAFSAASFLVIGLRGKVWDVRMFWAIPLMVAFFSYLYCFSALIALVTRSTMGAFLTTLLLWCVIFLVHLAESGIILQFKVRADQIVALQQSELDKTTADLAAAREKLKAEEKPPASAGASAEPAPQADVSKTKAAERVEKLEADAAQWNDRLTSSRADQQKLERIHAVAFAVKSLLPKTSETVELLRRAIVQNTELEAFQDKSSAAAAGVAGVRGIETVEGVRVSARATQREMQRVLDSRSVAWVLGTSLAFEAVLLAIGGWVFSRRDF